MQAVQLNLPLGRQRKQEGISRVASHGAQWLERARDIAEQIAIWQGTVTVDDVLKETGMPEGIHVNVIGALFHDARFEFTGRWIPTERPEGHARSIRVWRLKYA